MPCRHASVSRAHRPTYNYSKARTPFARHHARPGRWAGESDKAKLLSPLPDPRINIKALGASSSCRHMVADSLRYN